MSTPLSIPVLHRHTPLEACIGAVWGTDPFASSLPRATGKTPRSAIEDTLLPCLQRPPCLVAFSGGRDSSTVLAVAAHVARVHGLPLPIPATNRFPDAAQTDEAKWQEQVVSHLGLEEWMRLGWTDELDILGPYGVQVLRRHGPVMPFNAHFLEPLLERAGGGSMLTGVGGDELIAPSLRPTLSNLMFRGQRPRLRKLNRLAVEAAPRWIRTEALVREVPIIRFDWLHPEVRRYIAREYARDLARWPLRWNRSLQALWTCRHLQTIRSTLGVLGQAHDVRMCSPFLEKEVLAAYARFEGPGGVIERGSALVDLVGDLLPQDILRRKTKAGFDDPFFNSYSREFARAWTGGGVDAQLVDGEALSAEWRSDPPTANSFTLLQHAWLADHI